MTCDHCKINESKITLTWENDVEEKLCRDCYNEMMSSELGVTLEEQPKTVRLKDGQGVYRFFTIEKHLFPGGIKMEAIERIEFGYEFAVLGELDSNQTALYQELLRKAETGISRQYIKKGTFPNGQEYHSMTGDELAGRIAYDENRNGIPLIIVDGKAYSWEEFGNILMSNQGFQFKMNIFDMMEDLD